MICINYIKRIGDHHFYYTIVGNTIRTYSMESDSFGPVKHELEKNKAQLMISFFEDFMQVDRTFIDPGKDVHLYKQLQDRINSYIEWACKNIETLPQSVSDNGLIATKYMRHMIDMISPAQPLLSELIFIEHCASETGKVEFKEFE